MLVLEHADKSFGAVRALEDAHIELYAGEAHALVGENGAGKSTLVKILAGVHRPDRGRLLLDGEEAIFDGAKQSQEAGIAIIFQEPTLFPDLSVAENIFIGARPLKRGHRIDRRRMRRDALRSSSSSASASIPTVWHAASRSPTSSWSRSPRR